MLAPDFEATTPGGETVRLSQFRGEPVLLTFGTTWCPDCLLEAPIVQALHEEHPELVVLLVDSNESPGTVQAFVDEYGLTYPVLLDGDGSIARQYQVFAIPTGLFVDAEGVIRAKVIESVTPELLDDRLPLIGVIP
jgi:peroxiredoxin